MTRLFSTGSLDSIAVSVRSKSLISAAQRDLTAIVREAHGLAENQADDFSIMNSADVLSVATNTARTLTVLLSAIAAGFAVLVGVFFGFYPAYKAASLKPIEALRWE